MFLHVALTNAMTRLGIKSTDINTILSPEKDRLRTILLQQTGFPRLCRWKSKACHTCFLRGFSVSVFGLPNNSAVREGGLSCFREQNRIHQRTRAHKMLLARSKRQTGRPLGTKYQLSELSRIHSGRPNCPLAGA